MIKETLKDLTHFVVVLVVYIGIPGGLIYLTIKVMENLFGGG